MGFGVEYFYYERMEDGNYNKDDLKSMKRKVGEPLDDTSLELLASKVLAQLARRDIWIHDIKIFEYKKQEITFRETKGGIILKNKKFTLDKVAHDLDSEEFQSPQELDGGAPIPQRGNGQTMIPISPAVPKPPINGIVCPVELAGQIPIRAEIYDPEPDHLKAGLVRGQFTKGKKYPIFKEQRDPREQNAGRELPMLYITIDDTGKRVITPGIAFRPVGGGLIGGDWQPDASSKSGDGLAWNGVQQDDMRDIRRR